MANSKDHSDLIPKGKKICPIISIGTQGWAFCQESKCRFWISVYTRDTHPQLIHDCCFALQPQMVDGQAKV